MRLAVPLTLFLIGCGAIVMACQYTPVATEVREIVAPSGDTPTSATAPSVQKDNDTPTTVPVTPSR